MWNWITKFNKLWAALGATVAVFSLGSGTVIFYFNTFEPKGESNEAAQGVHLRVNDLAGRFNNFSTWVREQIAEMRGKQESAGKEVADQYRAINVRLDQQNSQIADQNRLLVEVLKEVRANSDHGQADDSGWSLFGTARAATMRNAN